MRDDKSYHLSLSARVRIWAAPLLLQLRDLAGEIAEDMPLLTRIASHLGLLLLMVLTIAASGVQIVNTNGKEDTGVIAQSPIDTSGLSTDPGVEDSGALVLSPIPLTDAPKRVRLDVVKYTVQFGDTVSDIAVQYEVSADSILWANPKLEDNPDMLSVGQVINVPPVSGVLYAVANGDTLRSIADKFKGKKTVDAVVNDAVNLEFNQQLHDLKAPDYALTVGQFLMIPGGSKPYVPRVVNAYSGPIPATAARGTGNFGWPVSGRITQKFWSHHPGIDIGAPKGTPIYAADSGYVVVAGWDQERVSYGFMILIDHGNGYITRYGHLSSFNVEVGDSVKKGQLIGRVGSTGNSTGPHLHFEIIKNGERRNPFGYLPGG